MDGGGIQERSWGNEIIFEDFTSGNYVVPKVFRDFDAIAVKHVAWFIGRSDVFTLLGSVKVTPAYVVRLDMVICQSTECHFCCSGRHF